jgi:hypothetical protein
MLLVMSAPRRTTVVALLGAAVLVGVVVMNWATSDPSPAPASGSASAGPVHAGSSGSVGNAPAEAKIKTLVASPQTENRDTATPSASTASGAPQSPIASASTEKSRYQPGPSKYKNARRPEARSVLAKVGADFEAEALWLQSINDPSVPANERQDLIEDLNEDGLSNPAKPTREDLVLIKSRIQLVERLLPSAIDKVNEDAFREARKDLVKMRDRLEE